MDGLLVEKIQIALKLIKPLAETGWPPAQSILRQLTWCESFVSGRPTETRPGPFSMGLIATREFDMYGDQPGLALSINEIQRAVEALL
jgi:hypothetical protein